MKWFTSGTKSIEHRVTWSIKQQEAARLLLGEEFDPTTPYYIRVNIHTDAVEITQIKTEKK